MSCLGRRGGGKANGDAGNTIGIPSGVLPDALMASRSPAISFCFCFSVSLAMEASTFAILAFSVSIFARAFFFSISSAAIRSSVVLLTRAILITSCKM
jgi:hypothetical protein